jgi:hypothetical protein
MSPPSCDKKNAAADDVMVDDDIPSLSLQTQAEDAVVYQDNEEEENGGRANSVKGGPDTSLMWKSGQFFYQFHEKPMVRCVWILLILRAIERSIFWGLLFINPGFLTGK